MGEEETYALLEIVFVYSPFGMIDDGVLAGWTFQSDEDNIWGERYGSSFKGELLRWNVALGYRP